MQVAHGNKLLLLLLHVPSLCNNTTTTVTKVAPSECIFLTSFSTTGKWKTDLRACHFIT